MNEIVKVFNDRPVRIIDQDGELWFVAKDVCKVLEIKLQANSTRYLDADERGVCLINTPLANREMIRVIEVGRERFGERNHRRAGTNGAVDAKDVSQINTPGKNRKRPYRTRLADPIQVQTQMNQIVQVFKSRQGHRP